MKTLKQLFMYSLFILFLTNSSCIKPKIPTGDHTFSCYIDGDLFLPKNSFDYGVGHSVEGLSLLQNEQFFNASADDFEKYTIMFNIIDWNEGVFNIGESDGNFYNSTINHAMLRIDEIWYHSKEDSGTVTFIEANFPGEVKGTFEFTLYNENDENDVIHVTNGQFDD